MPGNVEIAIASDHAGYPLKEQLKKARPEIEWLDLGTDSEDSVDYPDFGDKLAEALRQGKAEMGVLVCGSGIGISIAANRHSHIRAANCTSATMARLSREHNDANVLALGQRIVGLETALDCLDMFLKTAWAGGRHEKRVQKLTGVLES